MSRPSPSGSSLVAVILHRKNALFYKTLNGARVGDLFMSLIHTCQLNDVNPFDYLTELQRHAGGTRRPTRKLDALELPGKPAASRPYLTAPEKSRYTRLPEGHEVRDVETQVF